MNKVIKNGTVINEGKRCCQDILIVNDKIAKIGEDISVEGCEVIDAEGCFVIPGVIDDQVHFREPGLTYKEDIYSGSKAAVAGGVTSFMDMPNVKPPTTTLELLHEKQEIAARTSLANYSFYLGATTDNIEAIRKADARTTCGIKVFMGSSTGNMLVDSIPALEAIFSESPILVATHCEDNAIINANYKHFQKIYGDQIPIELHPEIRSREACLKSSELAVSIAGKYGTRLHILHLSTKDEIALLDRGPRTDKKITGEACVHHLFFNDSFYKTKGVKIRWNPSIKKEEDRTALLDAVNKGIIDVVATDHAPHTVTEKQGNYSSAAGGGPLVQHSLTMMLELAQRHETSFEKVVDAMCHAPATLFGIEKRGFIKEGYKADLCIFKKMDWQVSPENILYKCGWSPLEGDGFSYRVVKTFVNGSCVYDNGIFNEDSRGELLLFNR